MCEYKRPLNQLINSTIWKPFRTGSYLIYLEVKKDVNNEKRKIKIVELWFSVTPLISVINIQIVCRNVLFIPDFRVDGFKSGGRATWGTLSGVTV